MPREVVAIKVRVGAGRGRERQFKGRDAWTLAHLIDAGKRGVRTIDRPAPRWSEYVRRLRCAGISIETIHEGHKGPFPGHHGRYVLREVVREIERVRA